MPGEEQGRYIKNVYLPFLMLPFCFALCTNLWHVLMAFHHINTFSAHYCFVTRNILRHSLIFSPFIIFEAKVFIYFSFRLPCLDHRCYCR